MPGRHRAWKHIQPIVAVVLALVLLADSSPLMAGPDPRVLRRNLNAQAQAQMFADLAAAPLDAAAASVAAPGFRVSDFATGFATTSGSPNSGVGPVGLAFDSTNALFAMDYANGILYRFGPSGGGADATTRVNATPIPGAPAGLAFARDGRLYLARQSIGDVLELNPANGATLRTVATGIPCATGIATDPLSGDLFVSSGGCAAEGVYRISNFSAGPGTVRAYPPPGSSAAGADGLTFGPDGTLYVAIYGRSIVKLAGTNAPTPGVLTFIADVPSSDGTAVAASTDPNRPPFIFANRNDGIITRIDLTTTPPTLSPVATGGTRGDFVAVGPDGCLYATQSSTIVKVTNDDGTCSLAPTGAQPRLSLAPVAVSPSPRTGTAVTFTATLANVANPAGMSIGFTISGANARTASSPADVSGVATLTYSGTSAGTDTVLASASVGGVQVVSNPGTVTWTTLSCTALPSTARAGTPRCRTAPT